MSFDKTRVSHGTGAEIAREYLRTVCALARAATTSEAEQIRHDMLQALQMLQEDILNKYLTSAQPIVGWRADRP